MVKTNFFPITPSLCANWAKFDNLQNKSNIKICLGPADFPHILQKAEVRIVDHNQCSINYGHDAATSVPQVAPKTVCAAVSKKQHSLKSV